MLGDQSRQDLRLLDIRQVTRALDDLKAASQG